MPKRSSAIANDGLGVEYVAEVPSNGGGRSWHGAVAVADRDSGDRKMMLVFTDQRPPYANVNGRALAEALERHDCVARLNEIAAQADGDGIPIGWPRRGGRLPGDLPVGDLRPGGIWGATVQIGQRWRVRGCSRSWRSIM